MNERYHLVFRCKAERNIPNFYTMNICFHFGRHAFLVVMMFNALHQCGTSILSIITWLTNSHHFFIFKFISNFNVRITQNFTHKSLHFQIRKFGAKFEPHKPKNHYNYKIKNKTIRICTSGADRIKISTANVNKIDS